MSSIHQHSIWLINWLIKWFDFLVFSQLTVKSILRETTMKCRNISSLIDKVANTISAGQLKNKYYAHVIQYTSIVNWIQQIETGLIWWCLSYSTPWYHFLFMSISRYQVDEKFRSFELHQSSLKHIVPGISVSTAMPPGALMRENLVCVLPWQLNDVSSSCTNAVTPQAKLHNGKLNKIA